jgi:hypothetical protein
LALESILIVPGGPLIGFLLLAELWLYPCGWSFLLELLETILKPSSLKIGNFYGLIFIFTGFSLPDPWARFRVVLLGFNSDEPPANETFLEFNSSGAFELIPISSEVLNWVDAWNSSWSELWSPA